MENSSSGFGAGFEHVSITIPFKLSKHYGNPIIGLGPISGGLIDATTPCGLPSSGQFV